MLRCPVCGEEVIKDEKSCPSCGAPIVKKNSDSKISTVKTATGVKNSQTKSETSKGGKKSNSKQTREKPNSISTTKLFYLFLTLILIGAILIYSSGILDSTPTTLPSQQSEVNKPHSGVDLKNLEQINTLEEIIKKDPKDSQSLLELAHLLNDSGLKEKAIQKYALYLKQFPKEADVWVDMGVCYFETGKNSEAISTMEKALKINPRHQIANLNLGIVNITAGNKEKAIGYWNKAIEIDPTNEIGQKAKELITTH
ncbi:hypothetical protein C0389_06790 [bacterium]|nr:hypothetical protein [bacterium]